MKTRIKITELNNREKKYECQYSIFNGIPLWFYGLCIAFIPIGIGLLYLILKGDTHNTYYNENTKDDAIFNTIEEAKEFIDYIIEQEKAETNEEFGKAVKSIKYVKHP